jgi:hypothetical protein
MVEEKWHCFICDEPASLTSLQIAGLSQALIKRREINERDWIV